MNNLEKKLGFTPINKEDVFKSSPKLHELFKIKSSEVYFKEPENQFLEKMDNQNRLQGSIVSPDDKTCIDFEIVSDFLMADSSMAFTIRDLLKSNQFGISDNDFNIIKNIDLNTLKESIVASLIKAPKATSFKNNHDIDTAQKNINANIEKLNKKASLQQQINDYTPPSRSSLKR
ncbi:hypothetical protein [Photobacterium damselae]|uniref:hypothetical protein n=1 Tax=Photobacterium damselae TaxID=38293 RepID=UPI0040685C66